MSRVMTMQEAISRYVKSGSLLFIGGMQHGEPSAAIPEIIRQKIDHLEVVSCLTITTNLLIGEGLVDKYYTGYYAQDSNRSYILTRARNIGKYPVFQEYSHFGIAQALHAGQMGVPYLPVRSQLGSDMFKYNPDIKVIKDPFTGQKLCAVKAINPDVGIIHVQRCDEYGNAQKWGSIGVDAEGINASRNVIITTEKIVDSDVIRRDPNRTIIPAYRVSAVVEQPFGAYPMHLAGSYQSDWAGFLSNFFAEDSYNEFMKKYIQDVKDWNEFIELWKEYKGEDYFRNLEVNLEPSDPVYTGWEVKK